MFLENKKYLILISVFFVIVIAFVSFFFFMSNSHVIKEEPLNIPPTPTVFLLQPTPTPTPQGKGRGFEAEEFLQEQKESVNNTPLLQKLPAKSSVFSIEYINETHLIVYADISNKNLAYQEAQKWFVENNIDTSKILIEYR